MFASVKSRLRPRLIPVLYPETDVYYLPVGMGFTAERWGRSVVLAEVAGGMAEDMQVLP